MKNKKLLYLIIILGLLFTNTGALAATEPNSARLLPAPKLVLKYEFSPLTVYPPIVIFTATLSNFLQTPSTAKSDVEFYFSSPSLCESADTYDGGCDEGLVFLGSARLNEDGQAIFDKPLYPGKYSVVAKIRINCLTVWSNVVDFEIGQ